MITYQTWNWKEAEKVKDIFHGKGRIAMSELQGRILREVPELALWFWQSEDDLPNLDYGLHFSIGKK
jgi:hypothetical protein